MPIRGGDSGYGTPEPSEKAMKGAGSGQDPPDPSFSSSYDNRHQIKRIPHCQKTVPKHQKSVRHRQERMGDQNRQVSASTALDALKDEHDFKSRSDIGSSGSFSPSNSLSTCPRPPKASSDFILTPTVIIQPVEASSPVLFGGDRQVYTSLPNRNPSAIPMPIECRSEKIIDHKRIPESPRPTSTSASVEEVKLQSTPYINHRELQTSTPLSTTRSFEESVQNDRSYEST